VINCHFIIFRKYKYKEEKKVTVYIQLDRRRNYSNNFTKLVLDYKFSYIKMSFILKLIFLFKVN